MSGLCKIYVMFMTGLCQVYVWFTSGLCLGLIKNWSGLCQDLVRLNTPDVRFCRFRPVKTTVLLHVNYCITLSSIFSETVLDA